MTRPSRRRGRSSHRGGGAPLLAIVGIAAVPALVLAGTWGFASANVPPTTTTTTTTLPPAPVEEMTTDVLSFRRHPTPIAGRLAEEAVAEQTAAVAGDLVELVDDGSCLRVTADGVDLAAESEDLAVIPASNQKLVVAAVALDVLGADHRFRTEVRSVPPVEGVVDGDLHLIGGGDPLLRTAAVVDQSRYPEFNTTDLAALADQLVELGVERVTGDVVGDESRYDDERRVPTWGDDITKLDAGPIGALVVNDGRLPTGDFAIAPASASARTLVELLAERGIVVAGSARQGTTPDGLAPLVLVESEPLPNILVALLHTSDNHTAEMLVKEIGVAGAGQGTRAAGIEVMRATLARWGVPLDGVVLDDGSGLSRDNRLTCAALADLVATVPVADDLVGLLPVAGRDGTLSTQLVGTRAEAELRAKTGTLTDVKALTGSVPDGAGDDVEFALVLNGTDVDDEAVYTPVWERLVEVIGELPVVVVPDVAAVAPR